MVCIFGVCLDNWAIIFLITLVVRPAFQYLLKLFGFSKSPSSLIKDIPDSPLATACKASVGKGTIFTYFTATWCGPCKRISPEFDRLSKLTHPDDHFIKIDVNEESEVAAVMDVSSMPTFKALKVKSDGTFEVLQSFTGANKDALNDMVERFSSKD